MIRRALPFVAILASTLAIVVAMVVYLRLDRQDEKLNGNRVEQTRQSCRERNEERRIFRANFTRQLEQTRLVPAGAFEVFNVTKAEAIARLKESRAAFHPLDCRARVDAVRDTLD